MRRGRLTAKNTVKTTIRFFAKKDLRIAGKSKVRTQMDSKNMPETLEEWQEEDPNLYREVAKCFLMLKAAILREFRQDSPKWWGIAFALDHEACDGRSMADIAAQIGTTKASISHWATKFCRENGLPTSNYMKSEEAQEAYSRQKLCAK